MKRTRHSAEFKAKVALEATKELQTTAELSNKFEVHGTMITKWKRHLLDELPSIFSKGQSQKDKQNDELISTLYQQIGQLKVELDWLKKKSALLK